MVGFVNDSFLRELTAEIRSGYERTIQSLENQVQFLKNEIETERAVHGETRQMLQRALRLEPRLEAASAPRPRTEAKHEGGARTWHQMKAKLEAGHRRKPEDQTAEYWSAKNAALEVENEQIDQQLGTLVGEFENVNKSGTNL